MLTNATDTDLEAFCEYLEAVEASRHTVRAYRTAVSQWRRHLDQRDASFDEVVAWMRTYAAPRTRKARLSALASYYDWARATGRESVDPTHLVRSPKITAGSPRRAHGIELTELVRARLETVADRCAFALTYDCMLRVGAAAQLRPKDIDLAEWTITAHRKGGGTYQTAVIGPTARRAIVAQLERIGIDAPWLFPSPMHRARHLHPGTISRRLADAAAACGLDRYEWTAHWLRHSRAEHHRQGGEDGFWISRSLGHSQLSSTDHYMHPPVHPEPRPQESLANALLAALQHLARPADAGDVVELALVIPHARARGITTSRSRTGNTGAAGGDGDTARRLGRHLTAAENTPQKPVGNHPAPPLAGAENVIQRVTDLLPSHFRC